MATRTWADPSRLGHGEPSRAWHVRVMTASRPSHDRVMSESRPSHVRVTSESCPSHVRVTSESCPSHVRVMSESFPGVLGVPSPVQGPCGSDPSFSLYSFSSSTPLCSTLSSRYLRARAIMYVYARFRARARESDPRSGGAKGAPVPVPVRGKKPQFVDPSPIRVTFLDGHAGSGCCKAIPRI